MIGIGQPQARWREMPQSRSRQFTTPRPAPSASSRAIAARLPSSADIPSRKPELISVAGPSCATVPIANSSARSPGGSTTTGTSSPYLRAKSRSRWSPHGHPNTAPVP